MTANTELARLENRHAEAVDDPRAYVHMLLLDNARMLNVLHRIEDALSRHPETCGRYADDEPISCGWKNAVHDIHHALTDALEEARDGGRA